MSGSVVHFPGRPNPTSEPAGGDVAPPHSGKFFPREESEGCAVGDGGFDTVKILVPWPFADLPAAAGFQSFDENGECRADRKYHFKSLTRESWRGSWGIQPIRSAEGQFVLIEGSPAKAYTGQNLFLPEEALGPVFYRAFRPFLEDLAEGFSERWSHTARLFREALRRARVMHIDFTSHWAARTTQDAEVFMRMCDVQGGGVYARNDQIRPWSRVTPTSLNAGGRRSAYRLYLKQPEQRVKGHCPALESRPELDALSEGVIRFEVRVRGEMLRPEERTIGYWTAENVRAWRLRLATRLAIPGQTFSSTARWKRVRHNRDITSQVAAKELDDIIGRMTNKDVCDGAVKDAMLKIIEVRYRTKIREYVNEDIDDRENIKVIAMRKKDEEWLRQWQSGVDVWPMLLRYDERTRRTVRNNIIRATGCDVRCRKLVDMPVFSPAPQLAAFRYQCNWRDFGGPGLAA